MGCFDPQARQCKIFILSSLRKTYYLPNQTMVFTNPINGQPHATIGQDIWKCIPNNIFSPKDFA